MRGRKSFFNRNFFIVLAIDVFLLSMSWFAAYLVRFDLDIPEKFVDEMLAILPAAILIKLLCFYGFDVYRGMWRFTGIRDLFGIIKAVSLSTLLIIVWALLIYRYRNVPRSVVFIDWCFNILLISGVRLGIRLLFQKYVPTNPVLSLSPIVGSRSSISKQTKKLLILGAGSCGEKILREVHDNPQLNYTVVGFLDDAPGKIGRKIHGVPVRGIIGDLRFVAEKTAADELLIAIPSANAAEMRRMVAACKESGLRFKTVPSYGELIDGKITLKTVREVAYRDLIGRATVNLDEKLIEECLRGQRVMVTGAGGSIGSELCRQICRFNPEKLILFERAESPLYEIDLELRPNCGLLDIVPVLGDIQDGDHLRKTFEAHQPQIVFHAAAYKHVPMLELQPWKAVENNILGTQNLLDVANEFSLELLVLVSTDKAVKSANVMGASKRLAEMITLNNNDCNVSRTRMIAVRFGNVVGSVGSVAPLFKRQIENGGPVTVTHPDVTRYFMTIREASQLILQSASMGQGGEIFILDMGTPIKIADMAQDLIRLSGFEPDVDIKIEYIGLRPGEKLYEELITDDENALPTRHPKIMMLKGGACDLNLLNGKIQELARLAGDQDAARIKSKLQEMVPDYTPSDVPVNYTEIV
ncbi:MAG: polysaccharide biosynthesis protein [Deltaproteobacteria bacterium]|nr:polysaccharide biosynthesis protein [Deltaproteobacteria bacterium]